MGRVTMGHHSYGRPKLIGQSGHVYVGNYTSIADEVKIIMLGHNPTSVSTFPFNHRNYVDKFKKAAGTTTHPVVYGDVNIGSDVWIGYGTMIIGGVNIHHGAIIAAGSIVTKDVGYYEVVAGVPARKLYSRFVDYNVVKTLLRLAWWDWPEDEVKEVADLLCTESIEDFIKYCEGKGKI